MNALLHQSQDALPSEKGLGSHVDDSSTFALAIMLSRFSREHAYGMLLACVVPTNLFCSLFLFAALFEFVALSSLPDGFEASSFNLLAFLASCFLSLLPLLSAPGGVELSSSTGSILSFGSRFTEVEAPLELR